jgi:hypothetical protein
MPTKDQEKLRAYRRKWYALNRAHAKEKVESRRREIDRWFREIKSGLKCSKCPENHPGCLQFHHRGADKEVNVSRAVGDGWSKERILKEISKCDVLCANCHNKLHWAERNGL